nr:MAG TPA: hypothetical protein [Caudoviricetes sp.]
MLIPSQARQKCREGVTTRKSKLKIKRVFKGSLFSCGNFHEGKAPVRDEDIV